MIRKISYIFTIFGLFLLVTPVALADGEPNDRSWMTNSTGGSKDETPNQASDASFDKRLPPVLPGEIVKDSGGKKRVWSTSGPVTKGDEPEMRNNDGANRIDPSSISVVVDQRDDLQNREEGKKEGK